MHTGLEKCGRFPELNYYSSQEIIKLQISSKPSDESSLNYLILTCVPPQCENITVSFTPDIDIIVQHLDGGHPICMVVPCNFLDARVGSKGLVMYCTVRE